MKNLRTEKRKANVGERILIVDAQPIDWQTHENGDILTVQGQYEHYEGDVVVEEQPGFISSSEYEVIIENETEADGMNNDIEARYEKAVEQAREAIEELRLAALAKGYEDARIELMAASPVTFAEEYNGIRLRGYQRDIANKLTPITAQEHRDAIVEQAKADVEDLIDQSYNRYELEAVKGNGHLRTEFVVNSEKRTVVALLRGRYASIAQTLRGIAKCAPNDCFNAHIGKAIALRRALGLEVPTEYLNAPNPSEVRVGDVVCGIDEDRFYSSDKRFTLTKINEEDGGYHYAESKTDWIYEEQIGRIIDDTREGGAEFCEA